MELTLNRFTQYSLSDEETLRGQVLNTEQKWVLQNLLAEAALHRNSLVCDPEHIDQFIQDDATALGRITVLEEILMASDTAEDLLQQLANQQQE